MPINPESSARMNLFLEELAKHNVKAFHRKNSIYLVNNKKVSIRTTTKPGPIYWYDISESIMNSVEFLIYQTDSSSHFVLFPSAVFCQCYSKLKDSNRANAKIFYIDCKKKILASRPAYTQGIDIYFCSTRQNEPNGEWKTIFLG